MGDMFGSDLNKACYVCGAVALTCPWCRHTVCYACLFEQDGCPVCEGFCVACVRRLGEEEDADLRLLMDAANDYEGPISHTRQPPSVRSWNPSATTPGSGVVTMMDLPE